MCFVDFSENYVANVLKTSHVIKEKLTKKFDFFNKNIRARIIKK